MTIDIASLIFEIDSTQAVVARERLEALEKAGARVDAAASKIKAASDKANAGHREAATQITKLVEKVGAYEQALGRVGKQGAFEKTQMEAAREVGAWEKVEAALQRRNAAYRGDLAVQQLREIERAAMAEATALAKSAVEWEKIDAALERRNAALRGDLAAQQALETAKALAVEEAGWERIDALLDRRNAKFRGEQAIAAMRAEAEAVTSLEARIDRLMNSIDPTRAAQARLNAEMAEASALYKLGAISASDYARATSVLDQRLADVARGHDAYAATQYRVAGSSGAVARAGLNLGRQFTDIGVQMAGQTPMFLVLIQQLPQIADGFAQAKLEGAGFGAVLKGMFAPFAAAEASLVAVTGLALGAAVGFGLLHRELAKSYPTDLTDGLGLTEEQLKRVKDRTVDVGDTFRATMDVAAKYLAQGPLGGAIDWVGKQWNSFLDDLAASTVREVATIVGVFTGAYKFIIENWRNFPAVFGDFIAMGVNTALEAVERLVNGAIKGLNGIFAIMRLAPQWSWLPDLQQVDLDGFKAHVSGAAEFMGKAFKANVTDEIESARKGMERLGKEIGDAAVKRATDRALTEAGDPNKGSGGRRASKGPADRSDERLAQYEAAMAAARAEELQAQLALVEDVKARAALEKEILDYQLAEKRAELERQAAKVEADVAAKRITETTGALLLMEIEALKLSSARVAALKAELIDREAGRQVIHEDYARRTGAVQDQISILESERDLARYGFQRRALEIKILRRAQELERLKLDEIIATAPMGSVARDRAEAEKAILDLVQNGQMEKAAGTAEDAYENVARAVDQAAMAFADKDWKGVIDGLIEAFGTLKEEFAKAGNAAGKIGAVAGLGQVVGGVIGGTAGSAISGAASGAMAGMQLGMIIPGIGNVVGAAIGAVVGGIGGLLGGKSEEKQRRQAEELARQQAEHQRAIDLANAKREQEIKLLELTGRATEALKMRREAELAAMDASLQATQLKIWALEDEAAAAEKAAAASRERASLEIRLMEALGNSAGALAAKRAQELDGADAANRALLSQVFAAEDAAQKVAGALEVLSAAYEQEASVFRSTRDRMLDFVKAFKDFRATLEPQLDLSLAATLERTQRDFLMSQSRAATGDEEAMKVLVANGQAFAAASEANATSLLQHQMNVAVIQNGMRAAEAAATNQATIAEQQLAALDASVAGILQVNQSVLSVRDALAAYHAAVAEQGAIPSTPAPPTVTTQTEVANDNTSAIPRTPDWASYLQHYPDVLEEFRRLSPNNIRNNLKIDYTPEAFGQWHWQHYGQAEGRTPYATGGIMDRPITLGESGIGGEAGPEGILPLANVGGKMGVHATGSDQSELIAEVRALRAEVSQLRAANSTENQAIARSNAQLARDVRQIVDEGVEVHGDNPGDPVRVKSVA